MSDVAEQTSSASKRSTVLLVLSVGAFVATCLLLFVSYPRTEAAVRLLHLPPASGAGEQPSDYAHIPVALIGALASSNDHDTIVSWLLLVGPPLLAAILAF